jgi:hypothetical protein
VLAAVFFVEMQRSRVVRQRAEKDVVGLGQRTPHRMPEHLARLEFFKIESCHCNFPHSQLQPYCRWP